MLFKHSLAAATVTAVAATILPATATQAAEPLVAGQPITTEAIVRSFDSNELNRWNFYGSDVQVLLDSSNWTYVSAANSNCDFARTPNGQTLGATDFGTCTFNDDAGLILWGVLSGSMKSDIENLLPANEWDAATKEAEKIADSLTIVNDPEFPTMNGMRGKKAILLNGHSAGERDVRFSLTMPSGTVVYRTITLVTPPSQIMSDYTFNRVSEIGKKDPSPQLPQQKNGSTEQEELGAIIGGVIAGILVLLGIGAVALPQIQAMLP